MKVFINKSDKCAITITSEIIDGTHNKIKCICPAYVFIKLSLLEIVFLRSTAFHSLCLLNIPISIFGKEPGVKHPHLTFHRYINEMKSIDINPFIICIFSINDINIS